MYRLVQDHTHREHVHVEMKWREKDNCPSVANGWRCLEFTDFLIGWHRVRTRVFITLPLAISAVVRLKAFGERRRVPIRSRNALAKVQVLYLKLLHTNPRLLVAVYLEKPFRNPTKASFPRCVRHCHAALQSA